ncbi:hypothetical protein [Alicyclobacillus acidoterrestris]|uniref:Uncharacterized protein n=1 Tax=Alicyclobacillus acidoterrestris (strain ATCC 49025 / DSM 3922 / CIP 106132 / NCIMB 13137 / GD3B) TaxID=1356854 RepID=T0BNG4_ALIAG|nr:hypothetical protein [Alicyclobacillus acidoterrestris]EPZ42304.1 hypothetical protein N007_15505 [Alicyclobacillus acidoterrestris ATCC 49025]UNO48135.1 hypothetical protein K1I37_15825 [Alicyclobacillus acidoterrestris]
MNDLFIKSVIVALITFLLLEAFLPRQYQYTSFLFLVLESTALFVLGLAQSQWKINFTASARLFITYIALSALITE